MHFDTSSKGRADDTGTNDTFLNYKWKPKEVTFKLSVAVSINKKVNGIKSGSDLPLGDIDSEKLNCILRSLLCIAAHFYDPGGTCIASRTRQQRIRWIQYISSKPSDTVSLI